MQNVVSFKVSGSELSSYIDKIQQKSDTLSNSAIKGAIEQANKGKEILRTIDDQIRAVEKKNRIESQAIRSIALEQREADIKRNKDKYEGKRNDVFSDNSLDENSKKEKLNSLSGIEKEEEEKIKNSYRENLTIAKEQDRQSKIQTSLARENIDTLKQTARDNVKAIVNGDLKLADVIKGASTDEEKLVAKLTEEGLKDHKKQVEKEGGKGGIFGSLMAVDNINKLLTSAGQFTSTQNGFDLIKPTASLAGRIIGGVLGGVIGGLATGGVGAVAGAGIGASLGGQIGETTGELTQRKATAKQDFYRAKGRYSAVTGNDPGETENTANVGVGIIDYLKLQTEFAIKRGDSLSANKSAKDALYAEKGFGVDTGTSALLVELQRSSKENNRDLANLIGGVIQKGQGNIFKNGDNTFLNEFLGKFASLQKELLKTQTSVASGTTMDILSRFNKMGGEFDVRDPRSLGNINAIQNALSNPGTDNLKALSFGMLRRRMPNAPIFDILKERQKGLGSDEYLQSMLSALGGLGGDDSQQKMNLSGMFPGLSLSAVDKLFKNKDQILSGKWSMDELRSTMSGDFKTRAETNTPDIDKNTADINNSLLRDMYDTIESMGDAFKVAIENSLSGAVIQLNDGRGTISFLNKTGVAKNVVQQKENKKIMDKVDNVNTMMSLAKAAGAL